MNAVVPDDGHPRPRINVKFHEARRALGYLGRIVINDITSVCPHTERIHVVLVDPVIINHPCTFAGFPAGFHSLRPEICVSL